MWVSEIMSEILVCNRNQYIFNIPIKERVRKHCDKNISITDDIKQRPRWHVWGEKCKNKITKKFSGVIGLSDTVTTFQVLLLVSIQMYECTDQLKIGTGWYISHVNSHPLRMTFINESGQFCVALGLKRLKLNYKNLYFPGTRQRYKWEHK